MSTQPDEEDSNYTLHSFACRDLFLKHNAPHSESLYFVSEGRSEYWVLYDYMLYNKKTYLHTSPGGGGHTVDLQQMGAYTAGRAGR